jgi:hypothetical protein
MVVDDDRAFVLLKSFQDQLECYEQLLKMSEQQSKHIISAEESELLTLIEVKKTLLEKVNSISSNMQEEKELLEKTPMGEFSSIDEELDQVLKAIEISLKELVERESNDMQVLEKFQKQHNQKMEQLGKGKNIAKAYLGNKRPPSMNRKV